MPRPPRSTRSSSNANASRPARSGISNSCASAGYLKKQTYVTLFIGWPGGTWTPPTERALQFFVDNLPPDCIWNVSVMNPEKQWPILALAVALGGHVRVGYEDNPYIAPGEFAKNNAVLVERMVGIARGLGREVATPDEARKILGLAAVAVIRASAPLGLMLRSIAKQRVSKHVADPILRDGCYAASSG